MIAKVCYKHTDGDYSAVNCYRKSDVDEVVIYFFPENGETLPFPNGEYMIPFADFVQWFNERSAAAEMLTDEQAATLPTIYPVWVVSEDVKAGDRRGYEGGLYKCLQDHTTQDDWTPDVSPALWVEIAAPDEYREIKEGMLPTEAFALGEIGWYQKKDNLWKSLIPDNTYTPESYPAGWEQVTG